MVIADTTSFQLFADLACSLTGAEGSEIVVLSDPELRVRSGMSALCRQIELDSDGPSQSYGGASSTSPWASSARIHAEGLTGSIAVAPITGPSGEPGWVVAASGDADALTPESAIALEQLSALVEDRLDRSAEQTRLDELGEVLYQSQENLREARNSLADSNAELEQFAYLAAHELVAPLRAVGVYAEVLDAVVASNDSESVEQLVLCASEIRAGISLMDQQVQYLLELSRTQVSSASTEPVDVRDVVVAALDTLQVELEELGAKIVVGDLPLVNAKFVPFQSVIANLLSNAVRYRSPDRPLEIRIDAMAHESGWKISVFDNGIGVEASDSDRVFKLFERASTTTAGSGIGLALSRRIIESFDGTLGVDGGEPFGSEFWILMPRADSNEN